MIYINIDRSDLMIRVATTFFIWICEILYIYNKVYNRLLIHDRNFGFRNKGSGEKRVEIQAIGMHLEE